MEQKNEYLTYFEDGKEKYVTFMHDNFRRELCISQYNDKIAVSSHNFPIEKIFEGSKPPNFKLEKTRLYIYFDDTKSKLTIINKLLNWSLKNKKVDEVKIQLIERKPKPKECNVCKKELTEYGGSCETCLKMYCSVSCFQKDHPNTHCQ